VQFSRNSEFGGLTGGGIMRVDLYLILLTDRMLFIIGFKDISLCDVWFVCDAHWLMSIWPKHWATRRWSTPKVKVKVNLWKL